MGCIVSKLTKHIQNAKILRIQQAFEQRMQLQWKEPNEPLT